MDRAAPIAALAGLSLSADDLAGLAGVTSRRVRDVCAGAKVARGQFDAEAALRILLERVASPEAAGLTEERTGLVRAQRLKAEMEYALAKGEIAPIEQMAKAWEQRFGIIRANMMNIPQRVVVQIIGSTEEAHIKDALRAEITMALKAAAETEIEPDDIDEPEDDAE